MSTITKHPKATREPRHLLWAWLGVVLCPLCIGLAVVSMNSHESEVAPWWSGQDLKTILLVGVPVAILSLAAPVFAMWHGVKA